MKQLVKLKDIASYSKGSQINGDELIEGAKYYYLNGGINPSGKWNEANCEANTIAISEGGNSCGYVNYMRIPFWCGAHCYFLYDTVDNTQYLYYALKSQQDRIMKLRSGACMPNIKKGDLGNFEFFFDDDKAVQEKVTTILSKMEKIIDSRKKELSFLDDLIIARFVELFGEVEALTKRWNVKKFSDVTINCDSTRKPVKDADRQKMQGEYPYYGATGIVDYVNDYRIDGTYLLVSEDGKALEFRNKDIAFIAKGKIWVNNHAHVLQCTDEVDMVFLKYYMNLRNISDWVTGIDQKKLNRANMDKIPVGLPPLELQKQFSALVEQVDKLKFA